MVSKSAEFLPFPFAARTPHGNASMICLCFVHNSLHNRTNRFLLVLALLCKAVAQYREDGRGSVMAIRDTYLHLAQSHRNALQCIQEHSTVNFFFGLSMENSTQRCNLLGL